MADEYEYPFYAYDDDDLENFNNISINLFEPPNSGCQGTTADSSISLAISEAFIVTFGLIFNGIAIFVIIQNNC